MASVVTLESLRDQSKQRSDMVNSNFITTAEWNLMINASAAALYDKLVAVAEDYYTEDSDIVYSDATSYLTLPADFYKLVAIDYQINGSWAPMQKYMFQNRWQYLNGQQAMSGIARYRLVGSRVKFDPKPSSQTVKLWYIPAFTKLVDDDDELDGVNGWEEYVIVDCAIKARIKEESDTVELEREFARIEARINAMAKDRDQGQPEKVTDVTQPILYPFNTYNDSI
jgi:hypothetical protein